MVAEDNVISCLPYIQAVNNGEFRFILIFKGIYSDGFMRRSPFSLLVFIGDKFSPLEFKKLEES